MSRFEGVDVDGLPMRVLVGEPAGEGLHPAVLLAFHREGYSTFAHEVVDRFSAGGYVVAAPDLYHRSGDVGWKLAVKARRDDHVLSDMAGGLNYLRSRQDVAQDRIVVAGHCMGGRISLLAASTWPDAFCACLTYYGGGMHVAWGESKPPFELLPAIRGPVAGFFGNDDTNPSPADADRLESELMRLGVPYEFHRFDGTGHGYMFRESEHFRPAATEESWRRTFAFLSRVLT